MTWLNLTSDTVLVVHVDLEAPYTPDLLDEAERSRAARFVFETHRRRFIAAHSAMRVILGAHLGVAANSLRFLTGPHGKPRLLRPPLDVRFNLSHSNELATLALVVEREVGVDVEHCRPLNVLELADHVFSPFERERLRLAAPAERLGAFYRGWTRKESFIKARGDGMHFPLTSFDVSSEDNDAPQLLLACRTVPDETQRWTVRSVPAATGFVGALTVEGCEFHVVVRTMADYVGIRG